MTPEAQLIQDIGSFSRNPLGYVKYAFPWLEDGELANFAGPHEWQQDILRIIGEHLQGPNWSTPLQLAVSSGHGIGKTALISMICKWGMDTCEDCRVVVTANTESQLATKTWPEVCKWFRLALTKHWFNVGATTISSKDKNHEKQWRVDRIPWSENNTEAFAGLHNRGKRIIVIFDEGSAIADRIWEVTEGALTDEDTEIIFIAFGNPTRNTGRFRECFGRFKHRWKTKQIDSRHVEGTNKEQLDKWMSDYGEDSDFVRVRVRGEFPRAGSTQFISGQVIQDARHRNLPSSAWKKYHKILTVDVARFGDDRTVIGVRQGPKFSIINSVRGKSTVETSQIVCGLIHQLKARLVVIDGDGVGGGVVDQVKENMRSYFAEPEHRLVEFHGGGTPSDPFMYFNRRAEVWGLMRDWLLTADIPDDPELADDLGGPEYGFSNKNAIQLEKKDDMKKRGLASPDKGDTLAMSFAFQAPAMTHREKVEEELAATTDPIANYLIQLREHSRVQNQGSKPWWE